MPVPLLGLLWGWSGQVSSVCRLVCHPVVLGWLWTVYSSRYLVGVERRCRWIRRWCPQGSHDLCPQLVSLSIWTLIGICCETLRFRLGQVFLVQQGLAILSRYAFVLANVLVHCLGVLGSETRIFLHCLRAVLFALVRWCTWPHRHVHWGDSGRQCQLGGSSSFLRVSGFAVQPFWCRWLLCMGNPWCWRF